MSISTTKNTVWTFSMTDDDDCACFIFDNKVVAKEFGCSAVVTQLSNREEVGGFHLWVHMLYTCFGWVGMLYWLHLVEKS